MSVGMCRPTRSWFWSSWFRTGYSFQRRFLDRGIKNCGSRLYLLLKIVADYKEAFIWYISRTNKEISFFKKTGLFQLTKFLERSIKNWPIFLERGINFRANSRTGYKKLAHFLNGVSILGEIFFRRGPGVPSWSPWRRIPTQKIPKPPPAKDIELASVTGALGVQIVESRRNMVFPRFPCLHF